MRKRIFNLKEDPAAYISDATIHHGTAYIAGRMSIDPETGELKPGTMKEETALTLDNLLQVIKGLGAEREDILFINAYITDTKEYSEFNQVYIDFFGKNPPARATLCVKELFGGLKVEITAIAAVNE